MSDDTPSPLNNVITIDDERIKSHLERVVRGTVQETLNALLDAEGDRLCNAQRYERRAARRDNQLPIHGARTTNVISPNIIPTRSGSDSFGIPKSAAT